MYLDPQVDLQSYPSNVFNALTCVAVFILRHKRQQSGASPAEYRAWSIAVVFSTAISLLLLIMPWCVSRTDMSLMSMLTPRNRIPPAGGINGGDVSFFYAACKSKPKGS